MTVSLADAFARIQGGPPAPVMLIDTCSFLDLFRTDESQTKVPYQPRGAPPGNPGEKKRTQLYSRA